MQVESGKTVRALAFFNVRASFSNLHHHHNNFTLLLKRPRRFSFCEAMLRDDACVWSLLVVHQKCIRLVFSAMRVHKLTTDACTAAQQPACTWKLIGYYRARTALQGLLLGTGQEACKAAGPQDGKAYSECYDSRARHLPSVTYDHGVSHCPSVLEEDLKQQPAAGHHNIQDAIHF